MANAKKKRVVIGTHNGTFHCDDVFACFLLKLLPENTNAEIVRTRDAKILKDCDFVVDVGGVYDHSTHRYDHHQPSFNHTLNSLNSKKPFGIKLSSAGLIFTHYGHRIIANQLNKSEDNEDVDLLFDKLYETFVKEIDAIDNGVEMCNETPIYRIHTNISSRVKHLLPSWQENSTDELLFQKFQQAMQMVGDEFLGRLHFYSNDWLPAKRIILNAIKNRFKVDDSGAIIDLSEAKGGLPWKEHLFTIEKELNIENQIKFVIFEDKSWRVQSVPRDKDSFLLRNPLNEQWKGLRDMELSQKSGIDGCVFVHINCFIGGNDTREGCLQMARKSLI
ncbi:UPF0160 protein MYG1-like isoform X2 [Leptotrombidium deliense]|uniref:UPF0160 protein MYG1-like isoform X2 n=1 Tax=Leptotrombidium deliense TaxID=299467 RepID=A0A443S1G3_9ACAR|nr:UPF0160 protein MYG1-like isoform X2 [Leptotrombidium deliense]